MIGRTIPAQFRKRIKLSTAAAYRRYIVFWSIPMMDVMMVALGLGFFDVSIAYVYAC